MIPSTFPVLIQVRILFKPIFIYKNNQTKIMFYLHLRASQFGDLLQSKLYGTLLTVMRMHLSFS